MVVEDLLKKNFIFLAVTIFIITQVLLYFVLYIEMGRFTGDLKWYWFTQGHAIIEGKIPYLDFESHYSPLFPYLLGVSYFLINHFSASVLLFMSFAALTTIFLYKNLEILSNRQKEKFTILFLLSPVLWIFTVGLYQDEIIMAFFLTLSLYLWLKDRKKYSIFILGLGVAFTKITFLIFIPIFLIHSKDKLKHTLILISTFLLTFSPFLFLGADVLQPIKKEISYVSGPTIWTIMNFFGFSINEFILPIFSIILFYAYFLIYKHKVNIPEGIVIAGLLFMIFNTKVIEMYALPFLPIFFLYISNKEKIQRIFFYLFNILLIISYLFTVTIPHYFSDINMEVPIMLTYLSLFIIELFFIYKFIRVDSKKVICQSNTKVND